MIVGKSRNIIILLEDVLEMLYVGQLVYNISQLVLIGIVKFIPDVIYKISDLFQAFLQKEFKLSPS